MIHQSFKALKFEDTFGTAEVEVFNVNGDMAIASDDLGPILITRDQAKMFFGLVDESVSVKEDINKGLININGVLIKDASGGGDVLLKLPSCNTFTWYRAGQAASLLGNEYFSNESLHKMIDDDFNAAMEQCVGLL